MIIRLKSFVFTLFLLLGLGLGAAAQNKYDYAVLRFSALYGDIEVSEAGKEKRIIPYEKGKVKPYETDVAVALNEVMKMEDLGWELFNSQLASVGSSGFMLYVFYLRKPRE